MNSNKQANDKIIEKKCDNSQIEVDRLTSPCSQNNNMKLDQNTEKMGEKRECSLILWQMKKAVKTFDNEQS